MTEDQLKSRLRHAFNYSNEYVEFEEYYRNRREDFINENKNGLIDKINSELKLNYLIKISEVRREIESLIHYGVHEDIVEECALPLIKILTENGVNVGADEDDI